MPSAGLRRLLAAVAARRIDVIVVYKIDRLTRALVRWSTSPGWRSRSRRTASPSSR